MSDTSKSILVIDDEVALARALELKLTHEGFEVTVANNGEEAVEILKTNKHFDMVILDLVMPKMDGFAFLQEMKDKKVPVIVTSNLSQEEDIEKAKNLGALEYFVKSNTPLSSIVDYINTKLSE